MALTTQRTEKTANRPFECRNILSPIEGSNDGRANQEEDGKRNPEGEANPEGRKNPEPGPTGNWRNTNQLEGDEDDGKDSADTNTTATRTRLRIRHVTLLQAY